MIEADIDVEDQLAEDIARFYDDPLGFVMYAYPWGTAGTSLENSDGPYPWQREYLQELGTEVKSHPFDGLHAVMPIQMSRATGHGVGKSVMCAWLVNWIMSTRPNSRGTVTANTFVQLETKTWATIQTWSKRCITAHWFTVTGDKIYHNDARESWFCSAQTCKEENSEAFAGQHAADSTSYYIFDEASAVPDAIWEVAEGGLVKGAPMFFTFGNPTRNTGKFYRVNFGSEMNLWNHGSLDSRDADPMNNKAKIQQWLETYGEDSDFFKVRVRGLPPSASELQFIDSGRIQDAQRRPDADVLDDEPVIAGFDVSGGGGAWNVIRFRRGLDGRSIPPIRINGEKGRDRGVLVAAAAEILKEGVIWRGKRLKVAAMFIDSAFGAAIYERLRLLDYSNVHEVNFGGDSPDAHQANMRAYMYNSTKDWLMKGTIPAKDELLAHQLGLPGYHLNRKNQLVLESKQDISARGEDSPDDADAVALTFARRVSPKKSEIREDRDDGPFGWG